MELITDLHTHSKYAGACSENLTLENINKTCIEKGINLISTGDFTHPLWLKEIKEKLKDNENGIFSLKNQSSTMFILGTEVCTVFDEKGLSKNIFSRLPGIKKVHNCILAPNLEVIELINIELSNYGNLSLDGRPLLSISTPELVEKLIEIDKNIFIFPAHAWTPWFGVFGSVSGFDSIKEAYQDQEKHIYALETGLSSDPSMNWRVSSNDKYTLLSGSDAHSPQKLGREAVVLNLNNNKLSYKNIIDSIKSKSISYTIEFFPEEGKYHLDGHRNCNVSLTPSEAKKFNYLCPKCRKKLTLGVLNRVEELADRDENYVLKGAPSFIKTVPLIEVISHIYSKGVNTKAVIQSYLKLLNAFGTEFNILINADINKINNIDPELSKAIDYIRSGKIKIKPGYDGVFGVIDILSREIKETNTGKQSSISDF
ncbi:MAG: endonuclease Q family protein [Candidatus Micrarchaeaceae archaeon]